MVIWEKDINVVGGKSYIFALWSHCTLTACTYSSSVMKAATKRQVIFSTQGSPMHVEGVWTVVPSGGGLGGGSGGGDSGGNVVAHPGCQLRILQQRLPLQILERAALWGQSQAGAVPSSTGGLLQLPLLPLLLLILQLLPSPYLVLLWPDFNIVPDPLTTPTVADPGRLLSDRLPCSDNTKSSCGAKGGCRTTPIWFTVQHIQALHPSTDTANDLSVSFEGALLLPTVNVPAVWSPDSS